MSPLARLYFCFGLLGELGFVISMSPDLSARHTGSGESAGRYMETEGQDLRRDACGDLPLSECLECYVHLTIPVGVDCYVGDAKTTGGRLTEEGTRKPGDEVLLHGHIELLLEDLNARSVERTHGEVDGVLQVVQEGVEIELLLISRDRELHILLAVNTAKTCGGVKGT